MKKGFVFLETLIVLVTLSVTVVGLYATYTRVSSTIEIRKYYDNISDLYKAEALRKSIDETKLVSSDTLLEITKSNCTSYMSSDCAVLMETLRAESIYINFTKINSIILSDSNGISNSMREYLKTINKDENIRHIIVKFKYGEDNYYASLRV